MIIYKLYDFLKYSIHVYDYCYALDTHKVQIYGVYALSKRLKTVYYTCRLRKNSLKFKI